VTGIGVLLLHCEEKLIIIVDEFLQALWRIFYPTMDWKLQSFYDHHGNDVSCDRLAYIDLFFRQIACDAPQNAFHHRSYIQKENLQKRHSPMDSQKRKMGDTAILPMEDSHPKA
jgi:hypothetical protein